MLDKSGRHNFVQPKLTLSEQSNMLNHLPQNHLTVMYCVRFPLMSFGSFKWPLCHTLSCGMVFRVLQMVIKIHDVAMWCNYGKRLFAAVLTNGNGRGRWSNMLKSIHMPACELNRVMHEDWDARGEVSLEHSGHMGGQQRIGLCCEGALRSFHGLMVLMHFFHCESLASVLCGKGESKKKVLQPPFKSTGGERRVLGEVIVWG